MRIEPKEVTVSPDSGDQTVQVHITANIDCSNSNPPVPISIQADPPRREADQLGIVWELLPPHWNVSWAPKSPPLNTYEIDLHRTLAVRSHVQLAEEVLDVIRWKGSGRAEAEACSESGHTWSVQSSDELKVKVPGNFLKNPAGLAEDESGGFFHGQLGAWLAYTALGLGHIVGLSLLVYALIRRRARSR